MVEVISVKVVDRVFLCTWPHEDIDVSVVGIRERALIDVGHNVAADMAAGIGQSLGKRLRLR